MGCRWDDEETKHRYRWRRRIAAATSGSIKNELSIHQMWSRITSVRSVSVFSGNRVCVLSVKTSSANNVFKRGKTPATDVLSVVTLIAIKDLHPLFSPRWVVWRFAVVTNRSVAMKSSSTIVSSSTNITSVRSVRVHWSSFFSIRYPRDLMATLRRKFPVESWKNYCLEQLRSASVRQLFFFYFVCYIAFLTLWNCIPTRISTSLPFLSLLYYRRYIKSSPNQCQSESMFSSIITSIQYSAIGVCGIYVWINWMPYTLVGLVLIAMSFLTKQRFIWFPFFCDQPFHNKSQ